MSITCGVKCDECGKKQGLDATSIPDAREEVWSLADANGCVFFVEMNERYSTKPYVRHLCIDCHNKWLATQERSAPSSNTDWATARLLQDLRPKRRKRA